jgi:hypothetical protein
MRGSVWGAVAVIVTVLTGAPHLPRVLDLGARALRGLPSVADVQGWIAAGRAPEAAHAAVLGARARLARLATAVPQGARALAAGLAPVPVRIGRAARAASARLARGMEALRGAPTAWPAALAACGLALGVAAGLAWGRRGRRPVPRGVVRRLARRGADPAAIARRTRLAQDAVRSLAGRPARARGGLS